MLHINPILGDIYCLMEHQDMSVSRGDNVLHSRTARTLSSAPVTTIFTSSLSLSTLIFQGIFEAAYGSNMGERQS